MAKAGNEAETKVAVKFAELPIFGDKIVVSAERVEYNRLRKLFADLAKKQLAEATKSFQSVTWDPDEFCRQGDGWAHKYIDAVGDLAFDELLAKGCYDMDKATYLKKHLDASLWDRQFKKFCDAIGKINAEEESREEARQARSHEAKNRWEGFNDEGIAEARWRNMTGGLWQDAKNAIGRGVYANENAKKKGEVFERRIEDMLQGLYLTIETAVDEFVDCLADNGYPLAGAKVDRESYEKAERLCNNLATGKLPADAAHGAKMQILQLNPYYFDFYKSVYVNEGDPSGELSAIAEFFGLSLDGLKEEAFEKRLGEGNCTTIEDAEKYRERAIAIAKELRFDPKRKLASIDETIKKIETRLRTTFGKEYRTRDEAVAAQGDRNGFYVGVENAIGKTKAEKFYLGDRIPQKRLLNARASFPIPQSEKVVALIDTTLFGSGKTGLSVSRWGLRWLNDTCKTQIKCMSWETLAKLSCPPKMKKDHIIFSNDAVFDSCNSGVDKEVLFGVITAFYEYCHEATFFTDVSPEEPIDEPKVEPTIDPPKAEEPKPQKTTVAPREDMKSQWVSDEPETVGAPNSAPKPEPTQIVPKTKNKFVDVYMKNMKRYVDFNGRMGKNEFWIFFACQAVLLVGFSIISGGLLGILYGLAAFLPMAGAVVRRFHDQDRPGAMWLIGLVPIIGILVVLYFMAQGGTKGDNQYGKEPELL